MKVEKEKQKKLRGIFARFTDMLIGLGLGESMLRAATTVLSVAMLGGAVWLLAEGLVSPGWRYGALALLVGAGMVSYFGTAMALGAFRLSDLRGMRRRG